MSGYVPFTATGRRFSVAQLGLTAAVLMAFFLGTTVLKAYDDGTPNSNTAVTAEPSLVAGLISSVQQTAPHVDAPGTPPHEHPAAAAQEDPAAAPPHVDPSGTLPHEHPAAPAQEHPAAAPPHMDAPGTPPHEHPDEAVPQEHAEEMAEHEHPDGEAVAAAHAHDAGEAGGGHGGSTPDASFVRMLLLVTVGIAGVLFFSASRTLKPGWVAAGGPGSNLLDWPVIGRLLRSRHFPTLLIAPTVLIFLFIVLAGLLGQQDTSNPAVLLTWILWWPAVIFSFLLLGRIWCTACPFGWVGDIAQKIFSLQLKAPRILKNMWWRLGLFLVLTWATTLWALDRWPLGTAMLALTITLGAVTMGMVYQKRTFCRYVCPLGGIFGLYSMTAPVRIGVKDKQICQHDCEHKDCYEACAWFEFAPTLERSAECNLCLDCVRACPNDNITLRTQAPATELGEFHSHRKSIDEASTVAAVLGVALLQTMVMLNGWPGWEASIGELLGIGQGPVLYTIIFLTLGLIVPVILVSLVARMGSTGPQLRSDVFRSFRTYAYAFLPLGLALHAAHNFHHLFGEGGAMWTGLQNSVAQYTGWASLAAGDVQPSALAPNTLFLLQWLALAGGLYLAFRVSVAVVKRNAEQPAHAFRAALPILLFAVAYTVMNIIILTAPMAHRH